MIPELIFQRLGPLVGDRVYPNDFPQVSTAPVWPAIRYTLSNDPAASVCGTNDEDTDDVDAQLDVVAKTFAGMRALKAQVIAALENTDPPCSRQPGGFETFDFETKTHRAVLKYLFQQSSDDGDSP